MDAFHSALQGKVITQSEYFLVGSVLDISKDGLIEILRGLCDNPENRPIEFCESEYIYSAENSNGVTTSVRARCVKMTQNDQHMVQHFHLRYFGHTDLNIDREKKAMVRTYIDCLTSPNLNEYLQAIGFTLSSELLLKGYLFHKGGLKITVSKAYIPNNNDFQAITNSHFIEISLIVPMGQDTYANEVRKFADLLKPYVRMDKINTLKEELHLMK